MPQQRVVSRSPSIFSGWLASSMACCKPSQNHSVGTIPPHFSVHVDLCQRSSVCLRLREAVECDLTLLRHPLRPLYVVYTPRADNQPTWLTTIAIARIGCTTIESIINRRLNLHTSKRFPACNDMDHAEHTPFSDIFFHHSLSAKLSAGSGSKYDQ